MALLLIQSNLLAQDVKMKATRIRVEYMKNGKSEEILKAILRVKDNRYIPFSKAEVAFYNIADTTDILIGKMLSDEKGEAILIIDEGADLIKDSLGFIVFQVKFDGNDSTKSSKRKISIKQADMDVSFFQKDTIKYIEASANEIKSNGQQPIPIENQRIKFYVKGTFSELKFGEIKTDKNGKAKIEFPIDMPGDTIGVLTIVAKIEEDDTYGSIVYTGKINWGIPVALSIEKQRGLGDTDAPLWMVYTLITLLSAVWFHYFYVIYLVIKIKFSRTFG